MEPLTPAKRITVFATLLALTATAGISGYRQLTTAPLSLLTRPGLPMLDLIVKLQDVNGDELDASDSLIASNQQPATEDDECPALEGGDIRAPTVLTANVQRSEHCPRQAVWYVTNHPVAFTLYFNKGKTFLEWWDSEPQVKNLLDNRFVKGLFFGLLKSLKIKAEQLQIPGMQGEFLNHVLRDAIAANAELHYDLAHGEQGWVLSYRRENSDFADQALPAMAGILASSGYRLPKLPEPILELRIGLQHFFITQFQQRIYLAQSLEALLNVIDNVTPLESPNPGALSLVFRAEALIDNLLPVLTGAEEFTAQFNFDLAAGRLGNLNLTAGPWQKQLHPQIFEGVLASIPHDAFAALAGSVQMSPTMTGEDWRKLATDGPSPTPAGGDPGGMAVVWDFDAKSPTGAIGFIVANPNKPQASPAFQQYLRNPELSSECAGGSVFLAATAASLLTRMQESCEHQSLSPLDWQRGNDKARYLSAQLFTFINPGAAMRELFLAGGADDSAEVSEFSPRWRQDYETAKIAMRREGDKLFHGLPIFSYAGQANGDPVNLEGKTISQEVAP